MKKKLHYVVFYTLHIPNTMAAAKYRQRMILTKWCHSIHSFVGCQPSGNVYKSICKVGYPLSVSIMYSSDSRGETQRTIMHVPTGFVK